MTTRHQYRLELPSYIPAGNPSLPDKLVVRSPSKNDLDTLADLMLDAYRGTIDYDDETLEDARQEVQKYYNGDIGIPLIDCSRICLHGSEVICASLISIWEEDQLLLLVSYIMTGAAWKGRGLARVMLDESLLCLIPCGYNLIHAFITQGNTASEKLFSSAQFKQIS